MKEKKRKRNRKGNGFNKSPAICVRKRVLINSRVGGAIFLSLGAGGNRPLRCQTKRSAADINWLREPNGRIKNHNLNYKPLERQMLRTIINSCWSFFWRSIRQNEKMNKCFCSFNPCSVVSQVFSIFSENVTPATPWVLIQVISGLARRSWRFGCAPTINTSLLNKRKPKGFSTAMISNHS